MTFPLPIDLRGYRRPATPKEIADRAGVVLITSWNQALENGNFRTVAGSANNPEPTLSYYGFVVANDQFHGTQTVYAVGASDVVYRREFFLAGDGATFQPWELEKGTKLINDWQLALTNGRFRSNANAVGAPEPTLSYYGYVIVNDTFHGTQHVWAVGATSVEYEREFYLGGSGSIEYSPWRRILQPSEIIAKGATATGNFVRYDNGWQECTLVLDRSDEAWATANGPFFGPSSVYNWVFPQGFVATPAVVGSAYRYGLSAVHGITPYGIGTGNAQVTIWGTVSSPAGTGKGISLTATGLWK